MSKRLTILPFALTLLACSSSTTPGPIVEDAQSAVDIPEAPDVRNDEDSGAAEPDAATADSVASTDTGPVSEPDTFVSDLDLDMTEADFDCILNWTYIGNETDGGYYMTNPLGLIDQATTVAQSGMGGTFPVGTVIQLIPFEAMVKRKAGFSPETNDWEFFYLEVSERGTTIAARGTTDVVNQFGGNCFECHAKADPKWDFICGKDHGCDPLPFTPEIIKSVQDGDLRCGR